MLPEALVIGYKIGTDDNETHQPWDEFIRIIQEEHLHPVFVFSGLEKGMHNRKTLADQQSQKKRNVHLLLLLLRKK